MPRVPLLAVCLLLLAGCVRPMTPAGEGAVLAAGTDAPGYVIIGLAGERPFTSFGNLALRFAHREAGEARASHRGCVAVGQPASIFSRCKEFMDRIVLEARPGLWRLDGIDFSTPAGGGGTLYLSSRFPPGLDFEVAPGQVIYLGDFTVTRAGGTGGLRVGRYGRDDAAATQALAGHPGLGTSFTYRPPGRLAPAPSAPQVPATPKFEE